MSALHYRVSHQSIQPHGGKQERQRRKACGQDCADAPQRNRLRGEQRHRHRVENGLIFVNIPNDLLGRL